MLTFSSSQFLLDPFAAFNVQSVSRARCRSPVSVLTVFTLVTGDSSGISVYKVVAVVYKHTN